MRREVKIKTYYKSYEIKKSQLWCKNRIMIESLVIRYKYRNYDKKSGNKKYTMSQNEYKRHESIMMKLSIMSKIMA